MSRAYRISVSESLRKVVRGSDHVSTEIQLLEVLPQQEMSALLAAELAQLGFCPEDETLVRRQDDITIRINTSTGEVTVSAEVSEEVDLTREVSGWGDDDFGRRGKRRVEKQLREQAQQELEQLAESETDRVTQQATSQLEQVLRDLQPQLDGVVNRVTAQALKQKAAQIGEIREITEDTDNGSMTIVLEV